MTWIDQKRPPAKDLRRTPEGPLPSMREGVEPEPPRFISTQVDKARRFYLRLRPQASRGLTVICGGWERCAADYRVERRSFPYCGVEFVAAGRGGLELGGAAHALGPGSVFAYAGRVSHRIWTDPEDRLVKYFVDFSGARGRRLMKACGLEPGVFRELTLREEVQRAFEELLRAGERTGPTAERRCELLLEVLLLTISEAGGPAPDAGRRSFQTFLRCRQRLERDYLALTTVTEAAKACHVDAAYLCRLFARHERRTPHDFLLRLRMNHAAQLLETGRGLVREAADALGMDPFHFSRAFKRVHGLSPSAFAAERLRSTVGH